MKTLKFILTAFTLLLTNGVFAQTINSAGLRQDDVNIIHTSINIDYGVTAAVGYNRKLNNSLFPVFTGIEFSAPAGNDIKGDYKVKLGGQIRLIKMNDFQFAVKLQGVFRSYDSDFVHLLNFGSDIAGTVGYYRTNWHAGAEAGFDKAIVTHFRHSSIYKQQYSGVKDGWYEPATGGNFYYGIHAGYSIAMVDINLKAGKVISQDFSTKPTLPFFSQLGINYRF